MLDGKIGLIFGVANDRSYAAHIAHAIIARGGRCAFSHLPGEKNARRTRKAVESIFVSLKREAGEQDVWLAPCDAASDEDLDQIFQAYAERHDRLDFVVHSIAFADRQWLRPGVFHQTPRQAYLDAIDISAYTLLAMAQRAAAQMAASGGGSILAMSYYGSEKIVPGYNVMGVAKAALESTARYLAGELGQHAIRVNTISGGPLRTLASSAVGGIDALLEAAPRYAPLRRNLEGSEVGDAAAWLVSDMASAVTGQNLYVDCGLSAMGSAGQ